MTAPVIILVRPQMGENIGAAARAMMNFGLSELRLVAPRDGWPNRKAYDMAVTAGALLDSVQVFETLAEAVADLHRVYATSARRRDMPKPVLEPEEAVASCQEATREKGERSALVFGPERTGLTNEEVALADALIAIPTHPGNASLNVAQAVVILGYSWFRQIPPAQRAQLLEEMGIHPQGDGRHVTGAPAPPEAATHAEIEGFFGQLEVALDAGDFFKTAEKKAKMWLALRSLFLRAGLSGQEVRTLRGVVRSLTESK